MEFRYFTTYTGVRLPLKLVGPLDATEINNRNTFIRAGFDAADRLVHLEKCVYGEVALGHAYEYHASGALKRAEIVIHDDDDETTVLEFDESGAAV
ncbi:DUF6156 family protein [Magnetospirillum sulfuroxidans]|uniref:Uncharacterized protein n=1 Tax=Magnetospirillum sulfuroxidans TaxID=611300 RepID=A0ABS5I6S4_9PROT|nr:hypothetical protein [Magnetospirillum sulfuroxidans]